ncbi:hypothetical protein [Estrella lausannensis]|uniref:Conserved putative secreted protein n=1 Tax=Estrella lausannensis TaxID=483423 RepID=A0A0H5E5D6_9BACT|nr:hypothetical protein [Estrella lausannensis]CRX38455.1 Conserved putative secreted protein [Estrella lausannensis]
MKRFFCHLFFSLTIFSLHADNQTTDLSPVGNETSLPFSVEIELASFSLPTGIQAFASAVYKDQWIFVAGRTNGLHAFDDVGNNFPPNFQNKIIYVIDPSTGGVLSRSLEDPTARLTQEQIDILSVTKSQFFQKGDKLYIVGGYGINTTSGEMETKTALTEIDLKKLVKWVKSGKPSLRSCIRQAFHPYLQVTGGALYQDSDHNPFLLALGQNFAGLYHDSSNGVYTQQIRAFNLVDKNNKLSIIPKELSTTNPDYRRRDLNVVPVIINNKPGYIALSGVFTLTDGVWTVPIFISPDGKSSEPDPLSAGTFKQAMNNYNCPVIGLYSAHSKDMYMLLPGGISYGFFSGGVFQTDNEFPFINQVTTIKIDKKKRCSQYLMNNEYPYIVSTGTNPGNQLLFGAEAQFFPADVDLFRNGVIRLDKIKSPTVIGYIAGGIMSTLPNTNTRFDTTASPYVFLVRLIPRQ